MYLLSFSITTMKLNEIIKSELVNNSSEIQINYICGTTPVNSEYIDIKIGSTLYTRVDGDNLDPFTNELTSVIDSLKPEFPNLHIISKKKEFHFYYSGFNSVSTKTVPISISNKDQKTEIQKTGIVTEKYELVGSSTVLEVIAKYPDYELYKRSGFSFRGSQEQKTDLEGIKALFKGSCCFDIQVIDNEIHVNGFSVNDMD